MSVSAFSCALCDHQIRTAPAEAPRPSARGSLGPVVRQIGVAMLKRAVALTLILALLAGAALAGSVVLLTRNFQARAEGVGERTRSELAQRPAAEGWSIIEARVERAAELPLAARQRPADPVAARMLTGAAMTERQRYHPVWEVDSAAVARLGLNTWNLQEGHVRFDRAAKLLPGPVPDSILRQMARDTVSPWLGAWRAAARSGPLPRLWMYRPGFPGVQNLHEMPIPGYGALKVLGSRNAAAGVIAAAHGDTATALLRARENVTVGLHFMREPDGLTHLVGRSMTRDGIRLMAEVARAAGDSVRHVEWSRLDTALTAPRLPVLGMMFGWGTLATDAGSPEALQLLSNPSLSPGERGGIVQGVPFGGCLNAREILFGFDGRRAESLARTADALAATDVGTARMAELSARLARSWSEDAESAMAGYWSEARKPRTLRALDRVGLGGVSARLTICAFMPGYWR